MDIIEDMIETDSVVEPVENEEIENKEKDTEKVIKKYNKTKKNIVKKEQNLCEVLVYNERKKYAVVSINGNGFTVNDLDKNPGKYMKYTGEIGSPDFAIEMM